MGEGAGPRACLSPDQGPKEAVLTVRVDPHGRGRDVRGDSEVRDPQVLQGDGTTQKGHPPPLPTLDLQPWRLKAQALLGGGTSICRSLKTPQMLLLKPAPENIDVIG